ncbi:MAG: SLC13 family permease [Agathobacter sp.]|nr:SLC13 family permease [Agathobacter sp.]
MLSKIIRLVKKDAVLTASWILAIGSAFVVHPSLKYVDYIDFRTLGILWSLMIIMEVMKCIGLFEYIGMNLLGMTKKIWQLVIVLVFICFFTSMFITNDVALITFVPFSIMMLEKCDRRDMLIPVVVLQTIAANLGSMLTPIGNPQNLYLYGLTDMSLLDFIKLLLPYSVSSVVLLLALVLFLKGRKDRTVNELGRPKLQAKPHIIVIYISLFLVAFGVVLRVIPYIALVFLVLGTTLILYRKILVSVDYALLFTFVGFFIFIGNVGSIPVVEETLKSLVAGNEIATSIVASQFISNVPAALLLSGFTDDVNKLILGVNFGGLGTIIASMASLISYKQYARLNYAKKGEYFKCFTLYNLLFLVALLLLYAVI